MVILDGNQLAAEHELHVRQQVRALNAAGGPQPCIQAILFREDAGSVLYTRLKSEAAQRVGIGYATSEHSMCDPLEFVVQDIQRANQNPNITGIIIQKPWKQRYEQVVANNQEQVTASNLENRVEAPSSFAEWWHTMVTAVEPTKDVDGLTPTTLALVQQGKPVLVLPATCTAVLLLLEKAGVLDRPRSHTHITILGKSDLMGTPLYWHLHRQGFIDVELLSRAQIEARIQSGEAFHGRDVVVSATGRAGLVRADMIDPGVVLIDVGEPRGDVDRESVGEKPAYLSPVPGGVGPLTVVSLLENAVRLQKV